MSGWAALVRRAGRETVDDHMPLIAQALAFSAFLAIPSVLLLVLGLFTLVAEPSTIDELIARLRDVMPAQSRALLSDSLHRLDAQPSASVAMAVAGFAVAVRRAADLRADAGGAGRP